MSAEIRAHARGTVTRPPRPDTPPLPPPVANGAGCVNPDCQCKREKDGDG